MKCPGAPVRSRLSRGLSGAAILCTALAAVSCDVPGPRARISEEVRVLDTYPFSDPNPVPVLATDRRLYPYHTFEGYAATSEPREWKVVRMENDLVEVFVLPEVGGKVWGAVVKETGHEFIYRNEVMKFRDIALRGPWTSGGPRVQLRRHRAYTGHGHARRLCVAGERGREREHDRRRHRPPRAHTVAGRDPASAGTAPPSRRASCGTTRPRSSSPTTTG